MLTYNLLKLMQREVLLTGWKCKTIQPLRHSPDGCRDGGKVTKSVRQLTLQLQASFGPIERLRTVRCRIYRLG